MALTKTNQPVITISIEHNGKIQKKTVKVSSYNRKADWNKLDDEDKKLIISNLMEDLVSTAEESAMYVTHNF